MSLLLLGSLIGFVYLFRRIFQNREVVGKIPMIKLGISRTRYLFLLCAGYMISGCDSPISGSPNHAPEIHEMLLETPVVTAGQSIYITAVATDEDGDEIQYAWSSSGGRILIDGGSRRSYDLTSNPCRWEAPDTAGDYEITCFVNDGMDTSSKSIIIAVM